MRYAVAALPVVIASLTAIGCGEPNHATVPEVIALLEQPRTDAEQTKLINTGRNYFTHYNCQSCHQLDTPTRTAPGLRYILGREVTLTDGRRITRDRAYLARSVLDSRSDVVPGYPQAMSNYQFLPAEHATALVAYLESLSPDAP